MIVDTDELRTHLKLEDVDDDTLDDKLESLANQAEAAACDYCRIETFPEAYEPVRLAIMLFVSYFYEDRDAHDKTSYESMMRAFHTLLYPYRDLNTMF